MVFFFLFFITAERPTRNLRNNRLVLVWLEHRVCKPKYTILFVKVRRHWSTSKHFMQVGPIYADIQTCRYATETIIDKVAYAKGD